jgi:hypothetical protein
MKYDENLLADMNSFSGRGPNQKQVSGAPECGQAIDEFGAGHGPVE